MSESIIRVRYQETDQMGVVYHANYLTWFEIGRTDYIRQRGFTYQRLEHKGVLLPVVEVEARYLAPARYDDEVVIVTGLEELLGSKIVFTYQVKHKETEKLLVKGRSKHLWTDQNLKRINLARQFPEVFQLLQSYKEKS
ncbi:acyl-CoA thioester hydrolase [Seinonella peptonophila]|uniref:Acyl-CoA thioester hydrolase n=1 Tax=Seinonella peptonophila TaxID=112248 RepID=A0A1M4W3X5_9BACL|nr:thioesterase family protein [Seinonella peptonophila]SHE75909.1 acyl-CoA thioester hydrolase [Seinonella peptonophila]